jgi:hypothetical protein
VITSFIYKVSHRYFVPLLQSRQPAFDFPHCVFSQFVFNAQRDNRQKPRSAAVIYSFFRGRGTFKGNGVSRYVAFGKTRDELVLVLARDKPIVTAEVMEQVLGRLAYIHRVNQSDFNFVRVIHCSPADGGPAGSLPYQWSCKDELASRPIRVIQGVQYAKERARETGRQRPSAASSAWHTFAA